MSRTSSKTGMERTTSNRGMERTASRSGMERTTSKTGTERTNTWRERPPPRAVSPVASERGGGGEKEKDVPAESPTGNTAAKKVSTAPTVRPTLSFANAAAKKREEEEEKNKKAEEKIEA